MNKFIITTTINKPTKSTLLFCEIAKNKDWKFVIVGDLKTPHKDYQDLVEKYKPNVEYLDPTNQYHLYPELSQIISWGTIQRRNIGFVYAYKSGADVVATVDDDNIPYDNWGDELLIGKEIEVDIYNHKSYNVFDPLSITKNNHLWHRGYPIECVNQKNDIISSGKKKRRVLIQADLWNGDPDIDASARLIFKPEVTFNEITSPYGSDQISPFNSQNTFLAKEVLPFYSVLPFVGRMDDIWGGYILQHYFPNSIVYNKATVYQERNPQNLIKNLQDEMFGYKNTFNLLKNLENFTDYFPKNTLEFWNLYREQFSL